MKNQFEPNKKYFTISIYVIIITFICSFIIKAVLQFSDTVTAAKNLLNTFSPFLIGFLIAYLIGPLVDAICKLLLKISKNRQNTLCRLVSIFTAYLIVIVAIIGFLTYIIPHMFSNISDIINMLQTTYNKIILLIDDLNEKYPSLDLDYIKNSITSSFPSFMTAVSDLVAKLGPLIYGTSVSIIKWVINFVIAIIVSCYMIIDRKMMTRAAKRIIYAFLKPSRADYLWNTLKRANHVFSSFIIGKTIDSLIIGSICLILMLIMRMPFALLISIIICVTNMIPYFGPFIGAIPSAILIFVLSPGKAVAFVVMIIILQQIDGNIIGPRILGESTGLRPIWIIFAITLGGWSAGIIGMFLGVPCVAVIASLLDDAVTTRLKDKNIDLPTIKNEKIRKEK